MTSPIETNAIQVLKALFENDLTGEDSFDGKDLERLTNLNLQALNDAVKCLDSKDLFNISNYRGAAPFSFGDVSLNIRGKDKYHEIVEKPRALQAESMANEGIIRNQARNTYKLATAPRYSFSMPQGTNNSRQELRRQLESYYGKEDRATFLDEVCKLLNDEIEKHKKKCTEKDSECPTERGMHELLFYMKQEVNQLARPDSQSFPTQHNMYFGAGSTNNVATGANAVQSVNTGHGAQINNASGSNITQSTSGGQATSLQELVEQLKQALAAEPQLDAYREEIDHELQRIETQLKRPEPKRGILARSFEALRDLAKDGIGSVGGHAVFELLQQVPALLESVS